MDKMRMESVDMTAQNIEKIGALFPNCITETVDENGKPKKAINFDLLRQMLSGDVIEGDEAYEFTWVGKKAAIVEANKTIRKTLRPCKEDSVDWDTTENIYIEGDNLEVLKLLQESYLGKVKMIYIDPPYNTGHDFVYPDSFIMDNEDYNDGTGYFDEDGNVNYKRENSASAGKYHSDWCSMIYSRLMLARNLLSDDGVIFISIDYNEQAKLRLICDEVFGEGNFVGEIYWESKTKSQNTKTSFDKLQPKAEKIFLYKKHSKDRFNLIQKGTKKYPLKDKLGEYREYVLEEMNSEDIRGRQTMIYDISDSFSTVSPGQGKQWKLGRDQVDKYKASDSLFIRDGKVIIKMRPSDERTT
ncbi:site-specific DNA-methyltransferase, partial [Peptostreptococcus anaerobius]|uniref:site-specific DNA-methyltransferase n=1 Tax=Peptostreptococcus anaerobius TaxID=1261 RepID=UPI00321C2917